MYLQCRHSECHAFYCFNKHSSVQNQYLTVQHIWCYTEDASSSDGLQEPVKWDFNGSFIFPVMCSYQGHHSRHSSVAVKAQKIFTAPFALNGLTLLAPPPSQICDSKSVLGQHRDIVRKMQRFRSRELSATF